MPNKSRQAPKNEAMVKEENNLCPICWMPLCVGDGGHAEKWKAVQITFKGKPAFSVKENSRDFSRPVHVFGLNEIAGKLTTNYEACHYVHFEHFGTYLKGNGIWFEGGRTTVNCRTDETWPVKDEKFKEILFGRGVEAFGLFNHAFVSGGSTDQFLNHVADPSNNKNFSKVNETARIILNDAFMGCRDCNEKMSISDYVQEIFVMLFGQEPPAKKRKSERPGVPSGITTIDHEGHDGRVEIMVHYIMLSGMLKQEDREGDGSEFFIKVHPGENENDVRKKTWTLRFLMMWCALQILYCNWKLSTNFEYARHHVDYIYVGTMDFYISLWFYVMFCLDYEGGNPNRIGFQEFHYYYASILPMYLSKNAFLGGMHLNLSNIVFDETQIFQWKDRNSLRDIRARILLIFDSIMKVWKDPRRGLKIQDDIPFSVENFSSLIQKKSLNNTFFIHHLSIEQRQLATPRLDLSIESFVDLLGSYWYWFHFKFITMPRIISACRQYKEIQSLPFAAKLLWNQWCFNFNERVKVLGVRFHMQLKAQRIESFLN